MDDHLETPEELTNAMRHRSGEEALSSLTAGLTTETRSPTSWPAMIWPRLWTLSPLTFAPRQLRTRAFAHQA